jgi:tetratricopeptide (TPR) repeat protein
MRIRCLCLLFVVAVLSPTLCTGQLPSRGGRSLPNPNMPAEGQEEGIEIKAHVAFPNDRPVPAGTRCTLLSTGETPLQDAFTDNNGIASFRNLRLANYKIRVEGPGVASMTTPWIQLMQSQGLHQEWIHVMPAEGTNTGASGPAVVSAEAAIPEKARKEVDKGMELMDKREMEKATEHFQKALEIYPKYSRAWNNIGVIKARAGDRPGAKEAWQKAIDADDRFSFAYFNLARMSIADKQPQEAEALLTKGLKADPNNPEGLFLLASSQFLQGQFEQALASARKVHSVEHKQFMDAHLVAAQALVKLGQNSNALDEYNAYLKEYPDSPKAAQVRQSMAQLQAKAQ